VEGLQRKKKMTRTKRIIKSVAEYFAKKGKVMNMKEYMAEEDTPHRARAIRKLTGSWARLLQLVKVNFPAEWEKANKPAPTPKAAAKPKAKAVKKGK
jgi:hypothetical protein